MVVWYPVRLPVVIKITVAAAVSYPGRHGLYLKSVLKDSGKPNSVPKRKPRLIYTLILIPMSRINATSERIQLDLIHSVYKNKTDKSGEQVEVLVKEFKVKRWFNKTSLSGPEEYVTKKNTIAKDRSIVFDRDTGRFYSVWHSSQEVLEAIEDNSCTNRTYIKGYNHHVSNIQGTKSPVR